MHPPGLTAFAGAKDQPRKYSYEQRHADHRDAEAGAVAGGSGETLSVGAEAAFSLGIEGGVMSVVPHRFLSENDVGTRKAEIKIAQSCFPNYIGTAAPGSPPKLSLRQGRSFTILSKYSGRHGAGRGEGDRPRCLA
jgi:hypothetical protein